MCHHSIHGYQHATHTHTHTPFVPQPQPHYPTNYLRQSLPGILAFCPWAPALAGKPQPPHHQPSSIRLHFRPLLSKPLNHQHLLPCLSHSTASRLKGRHKPQSVRSGEWQGLCSHWGCWLPLLCVVRVDMTPFLGAFYAYLGPPPHGADPNIMPNSHSHSA